MLEKIAFWTLLVLNIYAYYLIGKKNNIGFILGFIGCVIGVLVFLNNTPMIIMYLLFGALNIKNYLEWTIKEV